MREVAEALGWPGRLARALGDGVAVYNLGVNGDTSRDLAARWRAEAEARSRNARGLLLFAFGFNDPAQADGGAAQVSLPDSIETSRQMLLAARDYSTVLWIGPTPLDESVNPMQTEFATWRMYNAEIARYDEAYAALADEIDLPYLRLLTEFLHSERYRRALLAGDRVHPGDDGYAMIAERIAGWEAWRSNVAQAVQTGRS